MEDLLARHRREARDTTAAATALRKSVAKGAASKQKKKEVQDQIAQLEGDLAARHARELQEFRDAEAAAAAASVASGPAATGTNGATGSTVTDSTADATTAAEDGDDSTGAPVSVNNDDHGDAPQSKSEPGQKKPSRQKQRLARKAAQMEEMRRQAELEAAGTVNMREVEDSAIAEILAKNKLRLVQTYKDVRRIAADYMRAHSDDFLPFLVDDNGDVMSVEMFAQYCDKVESSAEWGGQLEIQAVSMALRREIHVLQMGSPA
ncbi:OTU domain-containing protein 6B, partial [Cladochytrium tenue]